MKQPISHTHDVTAKHQEKKERPFVKAIGSVLFAIIASSHHWLHTLLLALGLTTLGTGLFSLSPAYRLIFLGVSLLFSIWFIFVAKKKWKNNRAAAWVYLVSSILSIIIVATSIPQVLTSLSNMDQKVEQNNNLENPSEHQQHHKQ